MYGKISVEMDMKDEDKNEKAIQLSDDGKVDWLDVFHMFKC